MSKYDIAFLSILVPEEMQNQVRKQESIHSGEYVGFIQNKIVEGIEKYINQDCQLINKLYVRNYGKGYQKIIVPQYKFMHKVNQIKSDIGVGFINLPFISSNCYFVFLKKHIREWAKTDNKRQKCLFAYALTDYNIKALAYAKKISPTIKTAIIVPDLPQYTRTKSKNVFVNRIKNAFNNLVFSRVINRYHNSIDRFYLFSEHIAEMLPSGIQYSVFEGIATDLFSNIKPEYMFDKEKKVVLYAGAIATVYGLQLLVDAFRTIKDEKFRLILCGKMSVSQDILIKSIEQDERIVYLGLIPRQRVLALELGANVLVNPRQNNAQFTRYSFPSKTIEYLSSGTPMVGFKLDGISDDYHQYINYAEYGTPECLGKTIVDVCMDVTNTYKARAEAAREYILSQKNNFAQSEKIMKSLLNEQ